MQVNNKSFQSVYDISGNLYLEQGGEEGWLGVIIPEESINLVKNPTMDYIVGTLPELYSATSAVTFTRLTDESPYQSEYGRLTANLTTRDMLYAVDQSLLGTYTFSIIAKRSSIGQLADVYLEVQDSATVVRASEVLPLTNEWSQYHVTFDIAIASTAVELFIKWNTVGAIEVAGWQLEQKEYPTTFIHGYAGREYSWQGFPYQSESIRTKDAINGGILVNLRTLGARLVEADGLGLPDQDHVVKELALQRGSYFTCTTIAERDYEFKFLVHSCNLKTLLSSRNRIGRAIFDPARERIFIWQPLDCGKPIGKCTQFQAVYESGFQQSLTSHFGEEIDISLIGYKVEIERCYDICQELTPNANVVHAPIIGVNSAGVVDTLSGGPPFFEPITDSTISPATGNLYVSTQTELYCYDGTTWTIIAIVAGLTNDGITAIEAIGNYIYVGMSQTEQLAGTLPDWSGLSGQGVAQIDLFTHLVNDIGDISAVVTPAGGVPSIRSIESNPNTGDVFFGGNFVSIQGTVTQHVARYDGSWNDMEPAVVLGATFGYVRALKYDATSNRLAIGGDFHNGIGAPTFDIANPQTFAIYDMTTDAYYLPTPPDLVINGISLGASIEAIEVYRGKFVVGGNFNNTLRGVPNPSAIAWYDESTGRQVVTTNTWGTLSPLGGMGITNTTAGVDAPVLTLKVIDDVLYIGGKINSWGTFAGSFLENFACGLVTYYNAGDDLNSGTFSRPDFNFGNISSPTVASSCYVSGIHEGSAATGGGLIVTSDRVTLPATLTSSFSGQTTVTLCDNWLDVAPKIYLRGTGLLASITNTTNNAKLLFEYQLDANEIIEIDLTDLPVIISSSFYNDISQRLLPNSSPSSWRLDPGENVIVINFSGTQSWICYRPSAFAAESLVSTECV